MIYFGMLLNFLAMTLGGIVGVVFIGFFAYGLYLTVFESFTGGLAYIGGAVVVGGLAAFLCNLLLALSVAIGEWAMRR